ncbi:MAG TPA: hypothetical protein VFK82_02025, partial [Burkholderiaceae bacterium]|nr:hypothetical protein [Burkholderiaceae bacterium]
MSERRRSSKKPTRGWGLPPELEKLDHLGKQLDRKRKALAQQRAAQTPHANPALREGAGEFAVVAPATSDLAPPAAPGRAKKRTAKRLPLVPSQSSGEMASRSASDGLPDMEVQHSSASSGQTAPKRPRDKRKAVPAGTPAPFPSPAAWFKSLGRKPFPFQEACWAHIAAGRSGLLHATTGAGKTYAVWLGVLSAQGAVQTVAAAAPNEADGMRLFSPSPARGGRAGEGEDAALTFAPA